MSARGRSGSDAPTPATPRRSYRCPLMRRQQLEIREAPLDGIPGIALAGEVDIAVAKQVEAALDDGIRESVGAFVLDLCDLEFLDSSGVSLIMRARALLAREARILLDPVERDLGRAAEYRKHRAVFQKIYRVIAPFAGSNHAAIEAENAVEFTPGESYFSGDDGVTAASAPALLARIGFAERHAAPPCWSCPRHDRPGIQWRQGLATSSREGRRRSRIC